MPKWRVHKIEIWCKEPVLFAKFNNEYLWIVGRYFYYCFTQIRRTLRFACFFNEKIEGPRFDTTRDRFMSFLTNNVSQGS